MSAALSATVADTESVARFVLTESWFYKDNRIGCPLRWNAFMPLPHIELSVYRTDGWSGEEIKTKGNEVAEERERKHREKQLAEGKSYPAGKQTFRYHGRGNLLAADIRYYAGLDVIPEPPSRHANIVGWPSLTGNRKIDEAGQMAHALKLQEKATYLSA